MLALIDDRARKRPVPEYSHISQPTTRSHRAIWRAGLAAAAATALLLTPGAHAQDEDGLFEVRTASSELRGEVFYIDSLIEFRLSDEAREALEAGVGLIIRIEVELIHIRRFWFDDEEVGLEQRFLLEYHTLSERYLVRNLNTGDQASFATLFSALNYLGRIERLPFIDLALLDPERSYDVRIRAELDTDEFPGPLRLLTFWRRDLSLSSDWYRWRLLGD